jgi:hypothetical protein
MTMKSVWQIFLENLLFVNMFGKCMREWIGRDCYNIKNNVIIYMLHYTFYYLIYLINNILCIAGMYNSMSELLVIIHS